MAAIRIGHLAVLENQIERSEYLSPVAKARLDEVLRTIKNDATIEDAIDELFSGIDHPLDQTYAFRDMAVKLMGLISMPECADELGKYEVYGFSQMLQRLYRFFEILNCENFHAMYGIYRVIEHEYKNGDEASMKLLERVKQA